MPYLEVHEQEQCVWNLVQTEQLLAGIGSTSHQSISLVQSVLYLVTEAQTTLVEGGKKLHLSSNHLMQNSFCQFIPLVTCPTQLHHCSPYLSYVTLLANFTLTSTSIQQVLIVDHYLIFMLTTYIWHLSCSSCGISSLSRSWDRAMVTEV
jgi:hypothetical protein